MRDVGCPWRVEIAGLLFSCLYVFFKIFKWTYNTWISKNHRSSRYLHIKLLLVGTPLRLMFKWRCLDLQVFLIWCWVSSPGLLSFPLPLSLHPEFLDGGGWAPTVRTPWLPPPFIPSSPVQIVAFTFKPWFVSGMSYLPTCNQYLHSLTRS